MRTIAFVGLWLGLGSGAASSAPVIETMDRLEINWATQKIRFYGEATAADGGGDEGFKAAERRAWRDGLAYASDAVRNLYIATNEPLVDNPEKLGELAREAARQVSTSTYSYNTTYFGTGGIRVHLENSLAKALEPKGMRFRQKEASQPALTEHTGLVIHLNRGMKPQATFQVVDEAGAVLYDLRDMAEESFRRGLMGRWFQRPTPAELAEVVGRNPLVIKARVGGGGRLVVARDTWEHELEGHRSLLINGTVALALP